MKRTPPHSKLAFSLVELSIVLVILGLLTGGILGGQALMRASELRSVPLDIQRYQSAILTFRDKYHALPGDMPNATRFWGAQAGGTADGLDATCQALDYDDPATGKETCNGDGSGKINGWREAWRTWQHLANAGLIEGTYTGVTVDPVLVQVGEAGVNMPKSKATNAGWAIINSAPGFFTGTPTQHTFYHGSKEAVDEPPCNISAEETWNVDMKIDDGRPGTGNFRATQNSYRPLCTTTDDPATSEYQLQVDGSWCNFYVSAGF